jgi:proteasome assembly chaperone (PAC2) family protein
LSLVRISAGHYLTFAIFIEIFPGIGTVTNLFELIHDLIDRHLVSVVSKFDQVVLKHGSMLDNAVDAVEFGRDRARARSSGHSQIKQNHVLFTG